MTVESQVAVVDDSYIDAEAYKPAFFTLVETDTGQPVASVWADDVRAVPQPTDDQSIVEGLPPDGMPTRCKWVSGAWQCPPPCPGEFYQWDGSQWLHQLNAHKNAAWARIKAARDAVEFAPFQYNGMTFDGDEAAQRRLGPTIRRAQAAIYANAPFEQAWKLADNTMVTLAAADFIAIEAAKVDQFNDAFFHAESLRARIDAAQTAEELDLITWS